MRPRVTEIDAPTGDRVRLGRCRPVTAPDDRVESRADELLPEEQVAGSANAEEQAETILEDSDRREEDRDAAPGTHLEHRSSDEATPPA